MNITDNYNNDNISETEFLFNTNWIVVSNIFNQNNCIKGWFKDSEINKTIISAKLDTGSDIDILSLGIYNDIKNNELIEKVNYVGFLI